MTFQFSRADLPTENPNGPLKDGVYRAVVADAIVDEKANPVTYTLEKRTLKLRLEITEGDAYGKAINDFIPLESKDPKKNEAENARSTRFGMFLLGQYLDFAHKESFSVDKPEALIGAELIIRTEQRGDFANVKERFPIEVADVLPPAKPTYAAMPAPVAPKQQPDVITDDIPF
jgi:hypothetical protein